MFVFNDGGRSAAGYKGETRDCVARSIAIATQLPYTKVYDELALLNQKSTGKRSARNGIGRSVYDKYLKKLGWHWVPTMKIGHGCKIHLRREELPSGRLIIRVSKHMTAMIDGVIHDTHDCSRNGQRCVYGYFYKP